MNVLADVKLLYAMTPLYSGSHLKYNMMQNLSVNGTGIHKTHMILSLNNLFSMPAGILRSIVPMCYNIWPY